MMAAAQAKCVLRHAPSRGAAQDDVLFWAANFYVILSRPRLRPCRRTHGPRLFSRKADTCKSHGPSSPFDKLRVRTTEKPVEILMLSLSKHKDFGPSGGFAEVSTDRRA